VAVHVTIHDVSPAWQDQVELALEAAHAHGAKPALLVVPNYHGHAALADHPAYCERLRELQSEGHEIYLHGYYHQARTWEEASAASGTGERNGGTVGRGGTAARLRHLFAQKVVSGGEAEFSDVSHDEALHRLDEGERMLRDAGLAIRGFVAPAWSMPAWVHAMLAQRGYSFTEDHTRVYDPAKQRSRASVVLNYASRTPGRLLSSVAWCRIARPARRILPARIAIHPADMKYALLRTEIESLLAWAAGDFVATGAELLAQS
jgi:predicted deacetylase